MLSRQTAQFKYIFASLVVVFTRNNTTFIILQAQLPGGLSSHTAVDMQQQDTELTGAGEGGSGPAPPPPDVTTPPVNGDPAEPPEEGVERGGGDPEEATTHHSSGYASSDSSGVGGGPAAATTPLSEGTPPIAAQQQLPAAAVLPVSIQSDPQQSAFRPAMPAQQVHICAVHRGHCVQKHDRQGPSCS